MILPATLQQAPFSSTRFQSASCGEPTIAISDGADHTPAYRACLRRCSAAWPCVGYGGASSELLIHYSRNPTSACAVGETSKASLRLPPDRPMHGPPLAWRQRTARHALAGRTKGRRPILFRVDLLCGVSPAGAISLIGLLPDPC